MTRKVIARLIKERSWRFKNKRICYHCFCFTEKLNGTADIGPQLNLQRWSKCCKSRYFKVYLHVVNHAISTKIFLENKPLQQRRNKIPPWVNCGWFYGIIAILTFLLGYFFYPKIFLKKYSLDSKYIFSPFFGRNVFFHTNFFSSHLCFKSFYDQTFLRNKI